MSRITLIVAALAMFASTPGFAQLVDYELESDEWHGLSELRAIGEIEQIELNHVQVIDYRNLDPAEPLIVLYPQDELDVRSIARFVVDGGRVLVADDFGKSESLLRRLEITRILPAMDNLPHEDFVRGNPAFPRITARGRHPLLTGVNQVVANHPSVLSNVGGPVLAYDGGGGLVYDMNLGKGKVIVVGDSSLFINGMLDAEDNAAFARNALRYVCREQPGCKATLVTKQFAGSGRYDSGVDLGDDVGDSIAALNEAIERIMDRLPLGELFYYLALMLALGLAIYLATVFPLRRTRAYSAYITDFLDAIPAPQSEFDWNISRFGVSGQAHNYALPLSILKEVFEEMLLRELELWPTRTGDRPEVKAMGAAFEKRFLMDKPDAERRKVRAEVTDLLASFALVPPRNRVFLDSDAHFNETHLLRYHRRAMAILHLMGLDEEYERRTRGAI